jgi:hypothetical protein
MSSSDDVAWVAGKDCQRTIYVDAGGHQQSLVDRDPKQGL